MNIWFNQFTLRVFVVCSTCASLVMSPMAFAGDGFGFVQWGPEPTVVEQLAKRIDHMERSLDEYGSIVIKSPDVWGESRLMRHRSDVENQLKARLNGFDFRINAVQATRDAAFLATAIALQEQLAGGDVNPLTGTPVSAAAPSQNPSNVNAATAPLIDPTSANIPRLGFLGNTNTATTFNGTPAATTIKVGIEPVIELDQLNRYLQHLNELRRLNEGDDNADAPGYALNLIRIPVSVLPGRRTEEGFGAEVEITIDPYISDEVLPLAFKDFVINGLVDRISFEVFEIARTSDIEKLKNELRSQSSPIEQSVQTSATDNNPRFRLVGYQETPTLPIPSKGTQEDTELTPKRATLEVPQGDQVHSETEEGAQNQQREQTKSLREALDSSNLPSQMKLNILYGVQARNSASPEDVDRASEIVENVATERGYTLNQEQKLQANTIAGAGLEARLEEVKDAIDQLVNPLANVNQLDLSVPASHVSTVDGDTTLRLALHAYYSLARTDYNARFPYKKESPEEDQIPPSHRVEHGLTMPEVQVLMRREAIAAYDFLSQPAAAGFWEMFSGPELARLVKEHRRDLDDNSPPEFKPNLNGLEEKYRTGDIDSSGGLVVAVNPRSGVHDILNAFFQEMQRLFPQARYSVTEALVWQILLESALVNDQLCKDMRETAILKNCPCVTGDWMQFYGPNPMPEARRAFAEYVKCKWPIHIFALDPVTQDQNIADSFSQRREMQMAMAIAAANQGLGGQALSRFVRRLEYDLETIELNRTAIGFSHGDNTFGWRFYPRVQAPPVPSNLRATFGDLLIGQQNRDSRVRNYKLEPGMRECTALVVMPSFVPQVTVDVRSNYFRLAKHKPFYPFMKRQPGYESSTELSRELTELRRMQQQCIADAHLYRDGEVFRLCKAIDRLDQRLPLQTQHVSVPWENELGGPGMFQSGAKMLKPELHGWYGTHGIVVIAEDERRNIFAEVITAERALDKAKLAYRLEQGTPDDKVEPWKTLKAEIDAAQQSLTDATNLHASYLARTNETTVYLTGKNFSVLNCRVTAGGVDVTNTIEVINRNLMQVRIPSSVSTATINHDSTPEQRYVAVHLATPHGATSRLLIPVERNEAEVASPTAVEQIEAVKKEVETLKADTKTAIESAAQQAIAISDSDEKLNIAWGRSLPSRKLKLQVYQDATTLHVYRFCPPDQKNASLKIVKAKGTSAWPKIDNTVEPEADLPVTCELAVRVTTYKMDGTTELQKLSVGPWKIVAGEFDGGTKLTAGELMTRIFAQAGGRIDCNTPKIQVQGYVRFWEGGKVTHVASPIVFKLEHVSPPAPTP